eukprot:360254-Chlamydomonas_euryale.AAC.4
MLSEAVRGNRAWSGRGISHTRAHAPVSASPDPALRYGHSRPPSPLPAVGSSLAVTTHRGGIYHHLRKGRRRGLGGGGGKKGGRACMRQALACACARARARERACVNVRA